jgi:hypothetical protein
MSGPVQVRQKIVGGRPAAKKSALKETPIGVGRENQPTAEKKSAVSRKRRASEAPFRQSDSCQRAKRI